MAWTKVKMGVIGAIVIGGAVASLVIQYQARGNARDLDESVRQQSDVLARMRSDNERLSKVVARAGDPQANDLEALARLRSEATVLRAQTNGLASLEDENHRLRVRRTAPAKTAFEAREESRELGIVRMNFTRNWVLAFHLFAEKNLDQFPTSFSQAFDFLPVEAKADTNLGVEEFEIVYQGKLLEIANPGSAIVIREKAAWTTADGKWARAYGFADGHSEIHISPDGNFDAWEKQHIIPAAGSQ